MSAHPSQRAIITGATSGIGWHLARLLAQKGYALTIGGRRQELLAERKADLLQSGAPEVTLIVGDLSDNGIIDQFEAECSGPGVRFLCNNAGFGVGGAVGQADTNELLDMITVHADAVLRLTARAVSTMRLAGGGGIIVNVGSLAGNAAVPGAATYVATKAFIERFSESVALEAVGHGIVVQALTPGFVKTDFHRDVDDYRSKQKSKGVVRWMLPEHVAAISLERAEKAHARALKNPGRIPAKRLVVVVPGFWNTVLAFLSRVLPRRATYRAAARRDQM